MLFALPAASEDGYDLWLRYRPPARGCGARARGSRRVSHARSRATRADPGLEWPRRCADSRGAGANPPGAVLFGTPRSSALIAGLSLELARAGREGYVIRSAMLGGRAVTVIAANSDIGVLYGAFHFLRLLQTGQGSQTFDLASQPRTQLRVLDHWDNLDRHVERGYAGQSIWDWHKLPGWLDPRYTDYARACASIGINGAVLTNVNANATSLTPPYLEKAAALANVFRPYGVRVYPDAHASARPSRSVASRPPIRSIPRCAPGGRRRSTRSTATFPISAASSSRPTPKASPGRRTTSARMPTAPTCWPTPLAAHGGIVMWRAFVYSSENTEDRAKQAYAEFVPLDGKFADNVLVQVKNGPIDFQPREPFSPAVRRDAQDAVDDGSADHQGIPRVRHAPRLSRHDVGGSARRGHHGVGQGLDGREGHRRRAARLQTHRHGRRRQHRHRIATGAARISTRPTGMPSAASPGTRSFPRAPSPKNGCA